MTAILIDILIVDSKHDLNVYTDINKDGSRDCCCAGDSADNHLESLVEQYKDLDFNKWAGTYLTKHALF
jgi:hypothetical protein